MFAVRVGIGVLKYGIRVCREGIGIYDLPLTFSWRTSEFRVKVSRFNLDLGCRFKRLGVGWAGDSGDRALKASLSGS